MGRRMTENHGMEIRFLPTAPNRSAYGRNFGCNPKGAGSIPAERTTFSVNTNLIYKLRVALLELK